jgi:hypothetical protein
MTRRAFSRSESIAPRHHGCTRVADAPITASLRSCAFPPVTSSGILSHGRDPPCWESLRGTSSTSPRALIARCTLLERGLSLAVQ